MEKPEDANFYGWGDFVKYAEVVGISLDNIEDWNPWWECWKKGYISAVSLV